MAVAIKTEPTISLDTPKILFRDVPDYSGMPIFRSWDISPDGKQVLTVKESLSDESTEGASQPKINVVLNWFEELKDRVPVD